MEIPLTTKICLDDANSLCEILHNAGIDARSVCSLTLPMFWYVMVNKNQYIAGSNLLSHL